MKSPLHLMSYCLKRGENYEIPSLSIKGNLAYVLLKRGNFEIPFPSTDISF